MNSKNKSAYIQALEAELAKMGRIFIKEKTFYTFVNGDLVYVRPDGNLLVITTAGEATIIGRDILQTSKISFAPFPAVINFFEQLLPQLGIKGGSLGRWSDTEQPKTIVNYAKGDRITFDGSFLYLNAYPVFNFHTGKFVKVVEAEAVQISAALQEPSKSVTLEVGDVIGFKNRQNGTLSYTKIDANVLPLFRNSLESGEFEHMFEVKIFKKSENGISTHAFGILTKLAGWEK